MHILILEQIVSTIEDCADVHVDLTVFSYSKRVVSLENGLLQKKEEEKRNEIEE